MRAQELTWSHIRSDLRFHVGYFKTLLGKDLANSLYDIVFLQVAFCHVHASFLEIFAQAL